MGIAHRAIHDKLKYIGRALRRKLTGRKKPASGKWLAMFRQRIKKWASNIRRLCNLVWVVVCFCGLVEMAVDSYALSEKNINGNCRTDFNKWKKRGGYGAFAINPNGYCGYSWDNESIAVARSGALSACGNKGKAKGCTVIRENNTPSLTLKRWNDCLGSNNDVATTACTALIESGLLDKSRLAEAYNDRGVAYDNKGQIEPAISDFKKSLEIDSKNGWASSNIARKEYAQDQYESALLHFKVALKNYTKGGGDYRDADKASIVKIQNLLSSIERLPDADLCNLATANSKTEWDQSTRYSVHVKEAKKRGLNLERCRALVPGNTVATSDLTEQSDAPNMTTRQVCDNALAFPRDSWDIGPGKAQYTKEAQRRGLSIDSCRVALGLVQLVDLNILVDSNKPVALNIRNAELFESTDRSVCVMALDKGKSDWDSRNLIADWVKEAKRRNLVVNDCRVAIGLPRLSVPQLEVSLNSGFGTRIALVIGNSAYRHVAPLDNPDNDAELIAATLVKVGFKVTKLIDADQNTMKKAMLEFGRELRAGADASLFYYSGHGVQVKAENYLIPVDASIADEDEVVFQAVEVNAFLNTMDSSPSKVKIVVLDACRNNPFANQFRSASRGLASVTAPSGSYIAYSTAPGSVAEDGNGNNSPYTAALVQYILQPGLKIEEAFKQTRIQVMKASSQKQVPWETTSLTGDFYFVPAK